MALDLLEQLVGANRACCTGLEGLCILLRRLAYPNHLEDLEGIFGRSVSELSVITNFVWEFLYDRWMPCLLLGLQMHVFKRALMLC